jgi:hypothetical protein
MVHDGAAVAKKRAAAFPLPLVLLPNDGENKVVATFSTQSNQSPLLLGFPRNIYIFGAS